LIVLGFAVNEAVGAGVGGGGGGGGATGFFAHPAIDNRTARTDNINTLFASVLSFLICFL
jgi:hypothetical protein